MLLYFTSLVLLSFFMAHIIPSLLIRRLRGIQLEPEPPVSRPSDKTDAQDGVYKPTPIDIVVVRIMLTRSTKLPPDLVDSVFDYAEYWAHSTNAIDYQAETQDILRISGSSETEDKFLLRSYPLGLTEIDGQDTLAKQLAYDTKRAKPLPRTQDRDPKYFARLASYPTPRLVSPARKIVFRIRSKDQGWGGRRQDKGTYNGSWTWFEAGLERFSAEKNCNSRCTSDLRHESPKSEAPALSVCDLRTIQPQIEPKPGFMRSRGGNTENQNTNDDNNDNANNQTENNTTNNENAENGQSESSSGDEETNEENKYRYVHTLKGLPEWEIQRNKTAMPEWQDHVVTWSYLDNIKADSDAGKELEEEHGQGRGTRDGSFVRDLKMGDAITIWGNARFPGWVNHVETVKIEVYWAV